jgi:hypothetical protein
MQVGVEASCRSCGEPTLVVPGETYREDDVVLFDRIEEAVSSHRLTRQAARQLVAELGHVTHRVERPVAVLLRAMELLPNLHFLIPALNLENREPLDRPAPSRAAGMLHTIVSARLRDLEANLER